MSRGIAGCVHRIPTRAYTTEHQCLYKVRSPTRAFFHYLTLTKFRTVESSAMPALAYVVVGVEFSEADIINLRVVENNAMSASTKVVVGGGMLGRPRRIIQ